MPDLGENIGAKLIFVITFLGIFAFVGALMPTVFIEGASLEYTERDLPEYFEAIEIQHFYETFTITMNETGGYGSGDYYFAEIDDKDFGGHRFQLCYVKPNETSGYCPGDYPSGQYLWIDHFYTVWWIFENMHDMKFTNRHGIVRSPKVSQADRLHSLDGAYILPPELLDLDLEGEVSQYTATCGHTELSVYFGYNTTKYNDFEDAWDHAELTVLFGIGFDQSITAMNVWSLIGMILFFQLPEVHPMISFIIGFPIWICIAYLIVRFILLALPFVG